MMVSFIEHVVLEHFSGISYGTEYLNLHRGQTIFVDRELTVEGWAWGKFEEDNGELIQGWFPQAYAEPREDGATVGDLKEKESQEISGVDVPACDVFEQPPPPPLPPSSTVESWVWGKFEADNGELIQGWYPQAFAKPREDGATVGDLKEKESQEISGVDVPACDVFQQPPPPPPSTVEGWARGKFDEDNGDLIQGRFPQAFAEPREDSATVGDLKEKEKLVEVNGAVEPVGFMLGRPFVQSQPTPSPPMNGVIVQQHRQSITQEYLSFVVQEVPRCDVFQQPPPPPLSPPPPPPPPSPPVTQDYWSLLYKRCLDAGLIKGGKENSDVGGSEWWHCPYCMKDIRVENLDAHLTKASHIKWYEYKFTIDDLNQKIEQDDRAREQLVEVYGVDVPGGFELGRPFVQLQPTPPPPRNGVVALQSSNIVLQHRQSNTEDYWSLLFKRCLAEGLIKGGKTNLDVDGIEWWHCPFCEQDVRAAHLDDHLRKESHIKW